MLAPAGHPCVDQPWVACQAGLGAEAEPLHDAGPQALDQHVRLRGEVEPGSLALRVLEVEADDRAAAIQRVAGVRFSRQSPVGWVRDAQHVRAEVGQQRAGERRRGEGGELEDADSGEWAAAALSVLRVAVWAAGCAVYFAVTGGHAASL